MKAARLVFATATLTIAAVTLFSWLNAEEKNQPANKNTVIEVSDTAPAQPTGPVEKTDEEWQKILTPEQYRILRKAGTELANGQAYDEFKNQGGGTYYCAGCDAKLFSSKEKFDSHCGWPSFYDPANAENVKTSTDYLLGYARTEVKCKICDGHLGHVFTGEGFDTPTDQRYCINGAVLKFVPTKDAGSEKKEKKEGKEAATTEKPKSE